jgi:hypothetical protein
MITRNIKLLALVLPLLGISSLYGQTVSYEVVEDDPSVQPITASIISGMYAGGSQSFGMVYGLEGSFIPSKLPVQFRASWYQGFLDMSIVEAGLEKLSPVSGLELGVEFPLLSNDVTKNEGVPIASKESGRNLTVTYLTVPKTMRKELVIRGGLVSQNNWNEVVYDHLLNPTNPEGFSADEDSRVTGLYFGVGSSRRFSISIDPEGYDVSGYAKKLVLYADAFLTPSITFGDTFVDTQGIFGTPNAELELDDIIDKDQYRNFGARVGILSSRVGNSNNINKGLFWKLETGLRSGEHEDTSIFFLGTVGFAFSG